MSEERVGGHPLAGMSLVVAVLAVSWAAILFKWRQLRAAMRESEAFLEVYHEGSHDAAYEAAGLPRRGA